MSRGCRPLTELEAEALAQNFMGATAVRDQAIFALGRYSGERISAILGLRVGDIIQNDHVMDAVTYRRATRKGKTESRTVVLNEKAKVAVTAWYQQESKRHPLTTSDFLFAGRKGSDKPLCREQFHRILFEAIKASGITGRVASHSMRKTFAERVYRLLGNDLVRLQRALGHRNISSTIAYLSFDEASIEKAVLAM